MKKYNFKTRLLCLLLSIFMLIPLTTQVYAVDSISNTDGHWAGETMLYWNSLGLFKDVPEDEFGIDKAISRGAFVHIFNRMIHVPAPESLENNFNDISEADWNYNDIVIANNIGYINGYPNKAFRAASPISREEMCAIVSRYYNLAKVYDNTKLQNFTDKDTIQEYATDDVGALAELEIVKGYPSGAFKPQNNITWAEAVTIITRFLGYINGGSGVSGRVYYEDKPVYNAKITIYDNDKLTVAAETTSDLYGDYIMDVPDGTYDITIKKDGKISMLADVAVFGDVRTYNKVELLPGQYVTGKLIDTKNNSVADKTLAFTGDSSIAVTTDAAGKFELTLPENSSYSIYAEVDGKIVELADFKTGSIESGLDLGDIILSSGKTTVKNAPAELPWWYLDSFFRDGTGKDNNEPDKKPDEDETPDYSKLPYREPKTMAELVELNGGVQPEIVVDENNEASLYLGIVSNNIIDNLQDLIVELNNVSEIFNFTDSRYEFILQRKTGNTYTLTQVYKEVPVVSGDLVVNVNSDGYIDGISSSYVSAIKYSDVDVTPTINEDEIIRTLAAYFNIDINEKRSITSKLSIFVDPKTNKVKLIWDIDLNINWSTYYIYMDAHTGEIIRIREPEVQNLSDYVDKNVESYSLAFNTNNIEISSYTRFFPRQTVYQMYNIDNNIRIYDMENKIFDDDNEISDIGNKELFEDISKMQIISSDFDNWSENNTAFERGATAIQQYNDILSVWNENTEFRSSELNLPIRIFVNADYDNACYYGISSFIRFVYGNPANTDYLVTDVVGHEFGHFIQDYYNRGGTLGSSLWSSCEDDWSEKQAGAILEGTADIFGMLIESIIENINIRTEEFYYIGEGVYSDRDYIRNHNDNTLDSCYTNVADYEDAVNNPHINYDGIHYRGSYLIFDIMKYMIKKDKSLTAAMLLEFWRKVMERLDTSATFDELAEALIFAANSDNNFKNKKELVINAFTSVGITLKEAIPAQEWYTEAMDNIVKLGILKGYMDEDGLINANTAEKHLTVKKYIYLLERFLKKIDRDISFSVFSNHIIITIPSSNQSMSLIFDESKDILRWEAFIITDRILNFCHKSLKKYSDLTIEYNFPYLDNTTKDKAKNYAEFIRLLANSETEVKNGLPKVDTAEVLNMYYGGLTYDQFYESYMYVKNSANSEDNTKYDFSDDGYQFTESQRVVLDSMYNIYMSLEKNLTPVVKDSNNDVGFNVCKPMTLASACYLLYAYMQK